MADNGSSLVDIESKVVFATVIIFIILFLLIWNTYMVNNIQANTPLLTVGAAHAGFVSHNGNRY